MILLSLPGAGLPFGQQLVLVFLQSALPLLLLSVSFFIMFRYLPRIMEEMRSMVKGLTKTEADYRCNCSRCQFRLRTKKGLKEWKRYNKREHKYDKSELI
jgi:hypothetical protein